MSVCALCGSQIAIKRSRDRKKRYCTRQCWLRKRNEINWQRYANMHSQGRPVHGFAAAGVNRTREYTTWINMRRRCRESLHYLRNGVTVAAEWEDPATFVRYVLEHLGAHPGNGWSLDRINNDLGYQPGNIRWANAVTQRRNQRRWIAKHGIVT